MDVSHEIIVREEDCCAGKKPMGMKVRAILDAAGEEIESLRDRLVGRFASENVVNPENGEVLVKENEFITEELANKIAKANIREVSIRSVFSCRSKVGVCAKCYGKNMATTLPVQVGESVGVIAAQSIGEPGTQLTMRTFHTGGIAATGDITQGLPRVEELFEVRRPKGCATLSEVSGIVSIDMSDNMKHVFIKDEATGEELKEYVLPFNAELKVKEGDKVQPGDLLNLGSVYPQDILRIKGVSGVQDYILEQVQSVYRSQGVDINDKHIEIIVRQMLKRVCVENAGDTDLLPGELVVSERLPGRKSESDSGGQAPGACKTRFAGHYEGFSCDGQLPFGGFLPGNFESAYRSGYPHQARLPCGLERKRDHRQADSCRYGHERLQAAFSAICRFLCGYAADGKRRKRGIIPALQ